MVVVVSSVPSIGVHTSGGPRGQQAGPGSAEKLASNHQLCFSMWMEKSLESRMREVFPSVSSITRLPSCERRKGPSRSRSKAPYLCRQSAHPAVER